MQIKEAVSNKQIAEVISGNMFEVLNYSTREHFNWDMI